MEEEERPSKLRRLDNGHHEVEAAEAVEVVGQPPAILQSIKPVDQTANQAADSPSTTSDQQPVQGIAMSKNQMKKLMKRQQWEEGRDYRKAKRKAKIADKRARKRATREEEAPHHVLDGETNQQTQRPRHRPPVKLPVTFVIDCGFDDLMMEKERISLGSQLTRSYSDNYQAPFQAHLVISSWGGLLKERFDTVLHQHYQNWKGVRFASGDFVDAAKSATSIMSGPQGGKLVGAFQEFTPERTASNEEIDTDETRSSNIKIGSTLPKVPNEQSAKNNGISAPHEAENEEVPPLIDKQSCDAVHEGEIVYLTSDSPNTLAELKPYSTYIIGGLVDKNRHKGICYKTACDRGIQTAKLPIGEFMEMQSRFVLATNHVVEIMVRWLECRNWGEAFMKVIPKRKGGKLKKDEVRRDSSRTAGEEDPGSESDKAVAENGDEDSRSE